MNRAAVGVSREIARANETDDGNPRIEWESEDRVLQSKIVTPRDGSTEKSAYGSSGNNK